MYTITGGPQAGATPGTQQPNQSAVMSTAISPPLSASTSGSAFDVMDKTGCNDLV